MAEVKEFITNTIMAVIGLVFVLSLIPTVADSVNATQAKVDAKYAGILGLIILAVVFGAIMYTVKTFVI